jgi:hypothetical protein
MDYVDIPSKLTSRKGENTAPVKNEAAIYNALTNIISTPKGSVPGHPEFGCGMDKYIFELMDPMIAASIEAEIKYALDRWEPRVTVREVDVIDDPDYNRILIKIKYFIKSDIQSNEYEYIYKQELVNV